MVESTEFFIYLGGNSFVISHVSLFAVQTMNLAIADKIKVR